ncbi:hypothetical protein [Natrinema gelatinilyticum]|uniref:hypothetical protein n=1 Tax=Natrinema gelatinilyticum TaxID=2961571 RepID=UPI0020C436AB|nr:hypothetical protein [Natrinema gelatinilyticum]
MSPARVRSGPTSVSRRDCGFADGGFADVGSGGHGAVDQFEFAVPIVRIRWFFWFDLRFVRRSLLRFVPRLTGADPIVEDGRDRLESVGLLSVDDDATDVGRLDAVYDRYPVSKLDDVERDVEVPRWCLLTADEDDGLT